MDDSLGGVVGNPLPQIGLAEAVASQPDTLISIGYGATFAMIAIALIAGAVADRAQFPGTNSQASTPSNMRSRPTR